MLHSGMRSHWYCNFVYGFKWSFVPLNWMNELKELCYSVFNFIRVFSENCVNYFTWQFTSIVVSFLCLPICTNGLNHIYYIVNSLVYGSIQGCIHSRPYWWSHGTCIGRWKLTVFWWLCSWRRNLCKFWYFIY